MDEVPDPIEEAEAIVQAAYEQEARVFYVQLTADTSEVSAALRELIRRFNEIKQRGI